MHLLKKGAEGDLFVTEWRSQKAILKIRKPKDYRNSDMDAYIRRHRTIQEAQAISVAKSFGIPTPMIYAVNISQTSIMMQYIPGRTLSQIRPRRIIEWCRQAGRLVGLLHKNGVMHGDLTTSNFILSGNRMFLIDFGLAQKTRRAEDHAVDLRLFREILNSAHAGIVDPAWDNFLSGYRGIVGTRYLDRIVSLVAEIEGRGRYATVV